MDLKDCIASDAKPDRGHAVVLVGATRAVSMPPISAHAVCGCPSSWTSLSGFNSNNFLLSIMLHMPWVATGIWTLAVKKRPDRHFNCLTIASVVTVDHEATGAGAIVDDDALPDAFNWLREAQAAIVQTEHGTSLLPEYFSSYA